MVIRFQLVKDGHLIVAEGDAILEFGEHDTNILISRYHLEALKQPEWSGTLELRFRLLDRRRR